MAENRAATCVKLRTGGFPAQVFTPSHFAGVLIKMGPRDMVMLADLRLPQPGEIALRLVCAGAIRAIGLTMIDPLHLEACMKIIPSPGLVGMDDAPSGDAAADDRHGLGLMLHDGCHGLAAALAHDHNAEALAVLVFAPTPINASDAIIFGPNIAVTTCKHPAAGSQSSDRRAQIDCNWVFSLGSQSLQMGSKSLQTGSQTSASCARSLQMRPAHVLATFNHALQRGSFGHRTRLSYLRSDTSLIDGFLDRRDAMLIGYARVSTDDQNLDLQRDALRAAGCDKIYEDRMSGAKAARPGLAMVMEVARSGDVLTVWRLDRLCQMARNDEILETFTKRGTYSRDKIRQNPQ
jgi:hypothetical protein